MANPRIPRLPGETEDEFRRRTNREAQARRRAKLPKSEKLRGADAKPRKNSPFTPEELAALRQQPGENKREWENRCHRARHAKRREKNPEYRADQNRAWREANADRERERVLSWARDNPEKVKAGQKAYYHRNKAKRGAAARAWRQANPERARERAQRWYAENPGLNAHYSAKWRKQARIATPPWADMKVIEAVYREMRRTSAETGVPHEVDHIVPLRGDGLWGLHVASNLRIVPQSVNAQKHNSIDHELIYALMWADCERENERWREFATTPLKARLSA